MRLVRVATAAIAIGVMFCAFPAAADRLTEAYARVLADPADSELSLQYALIAEGRHEYRKALGAYERVLLNDPGNATAKRGLMRVRRIIQPPSTQFFAEAGTTWRSNAELSASRPESDVTPYAQLQVNDERLIGGYRWRTLATAYGEYYTDHHDLNYGNLSVDTGPLIDLGASMLTFRPSVGGAVASSDNKLFYDEINASALLQGYLGGAYQWVRVRTGYREFAPFATSTSGWYVETTGKWAFQNVITDRDVASIAPWFRWSEVGGATVNSLSETFSPGRYVDGGTKLEYSRDLTDRLLLALNVRLSARRYAIDRTANGDNRVDYRVSPGAMLLVRNAFGPQSDLRFNYRFDENFSNDAAHRWDGHSLTAAVVFRR